jgi:hypothetical protein
VATIDRKGWIKTYRLAGDQLKLSVGWVRVSGVLPRRDLVPVPQFGEIAVIDQKKGLRYLNAETAVDTKQPRELAGQRGTMLSGSPDGRHHALGGSRDGTGFADVLWSGPADVAALAGQPMAAMTRGDLAAVTSRLRDLAPGAAARPFLDLLRECLEHRFAGLITPDIGGRG